MESSTYKVEKSDICIVPIGDIHYPSEGADLDLLKAVIEEGLDNDALFLGMGDYIELVSTSNRQKITSAGLYDTFMAEQDQLVEERLAELYAILARTRNHWVGLVEGHHYWDFKTETSDQKLAKLLNAPFLGTVGWPIRVKMDGGTLIIHAQHGSGSARTAGAVIRKLERDVAPFFQADVYLMGHYHQREARKRAIMVNGGYKDCILACTGSFLRGYVKGHTVRGIPRGTYIEQRGYAPTSLGAIKVWADIWEGKLKVEVTL